MALCYSTADPEARVFSAIWSEPPWTVFKTRGNCPRARLCILPVTGKGNCGHNDKISLSQYLLGEMMVLFSFSSESLLFSERRKWFTVVVLP